MHCDLTHYIHSLHSSMKGKLPDYISIESAQLMMNRTNTHTHTTSIKNVYALVKIAGCYYQCTVCCDQNKIPIAKKNKILIHRSMSINQYEQKHKIFPKILSYCDFIRPNQFYSKPTRIFFQPFPEWTFETLLLLKFILYTYPAPNQQLNK